MSERLFQWEDICKSVCETACAYLYTFVRVRV